MVSFNVINDDADPRAPDRIARVDWITAIFTGTLSFILYLFGLAPSIDTDFSGIFSTGANYAAIPHPSGYPVWTVYAWVFTRLLPFSNIAWRVAVSSAAAAAICDGLIALMVSFVGSRLFGKVLASFPQRQQAWGRLICGTLGGMSFGFNQAFWGTALTGGAWPMTILLFVLDLLFLTQWIFTGRRRFLFAAALTYGLSITNSLTLLSVGPGFLVFALSGFRNHRTILSSIIISAFLFLIGLCAFLYLPLASMTNPPINWGYPRTTEGFLHTIKRGQYESIQPTLSWQIFMEQIVMYARVTVKAFGWYYFPALLVFLFGLVRFSADRRWLAGIVVTYLCATLLLIWVLNPRTDRMGEELNLIFFSLSYVILAIVVGVGFLLAACIIGRAESK